MKKIFTLFFGSLLSLSLFAYDGSRLSISTVSKGTDLRIEIDGRKLNLQENGIMLNNISEGNHSIRIYKEKKNAYGFTKRQNLLYAGSVFVKRGFHTDITVNRFGKIFVDERRIDRNEDWDTDEGYYDDEPGDWGGVGNSNIMSVREFDLLQKQLRAEWLENNRLASAKVIIDKTNFTSQQVKDIMLLFTFDANRLEVAKYAYRQTVDKKNYFIVNDAFNYNSSKDELARFIREAH